MSTNFRKFPDGGIQLIPRSTDPSNPVAGDIQFSDGTARPAGLWEYKSGAWTQISSADSGSTNYILNADADVDTTGYATYADAAGSSPVDGTGGSANVTFTRTTSSPLRDSASFLFTKDAANRQGQGASYDFTIDSADKAKVLQISMDYAVASGTYASGDLTAYIYDVTNAVVIQPAGFSIQSATTDLPQKLIATFQTASNSTSYRLIFHVASTSASAYTVKMDSISVGPQIVQYGAPVTDWVLYTPTFTNLTAASSSFWWRRIGDTMQIKGAVTPSAVSGSIGISLPSGYSRDTSKEEGFGGSGSSSTYLSTCTAYDNSAGSHFEGVVQFNGASTTTMQILNAEGTGSIWNASVPMTWAASDYLNFRIQVPILGWSSSVQMSNDTDTRVVAAKYTQSSGQSISANDTVDTILYNTSVYDTHASYNTSNGRFTAPVPGKYLVNAKARLSSTAFPSGNITLFLYKNGSAIEYLDNQVNYEAGTRAVFIGGHATIDLAAGDYIDVRISQPAGSAVALGSNSQFNVIEIERLSGPSAIAATESVVARYNNSSTAVTGTQATVVWTNKDYDSHNAMSSGQFTAPVSGKYDVICSLVLNGTFALNNVTSLYLQKNGSDVTLRQVYSAGAVTRQDVIMFDTISLVAGDVIRVQIASDATGPSILSSTLRNYITIKRVGN